jgi:hypothetical protein
MKKKVLKQCCSVMLHDKQTRPCLITYRTLHNSGCYYSQFFILFLHFPITINIKTFSLFISHQQFFIIIQIKKFTTIQNFFIFLYKFFLFYITSSPFTNFKTNNLLQCKIMNNNHHYRVMLRRLSKKA